MFKEGVIVDEERDCYNCEHCHEDLECWLFCDVTNYGLGYSAPGGLANICEDYEEKE